MKNDKFILDATAGYRMMHFDKHHPNVLYLDQRPECEPDLIGDFRNLKEIKDETFKLIIFDPPHIVKSGKVNDMNMTRLYGMLQTETWQSDLAQGAKELWRVLDTYGVLLFKWCNQQVSSNEVISLFPAKPIVYQISTNKKNDYSTGKRKREIQTMWFCFMKIP